MATSGLFFLLVTAVAVVNAGVVRESVPDPDPGMENLPRCSTECSMTEYTLLHYLIGGTYYYTYSGTSSVSVTSVPADTSPTLWNAQVGFTWLSPCDIAVTFQNVTVQGKTDIPEVSILESYPMVLAVSDAHVRHVCTHPEDEAWSINWKKGVASMFQLSLPTRSAVSSGLEFVEEDVVGKCPTKYEVKKVKNSITVRKEKNHRDCRHRHTTPFETASPWLKFPVPVKESKSACTYELINGIYKKIVCEDINIIRPSFGSYKYIEARQDSTLRYKAMRPEAPDCVLHHKGPMVKKNLLLDYEPPKKDASLMPHLDKTLKEICEKTKMRIEEDSAVLMAKALHILRRIPGTSIEAIWRKITAGEICPDYQRLESLFLDAIAFVHEPSAVGIIVKQLLSGRATGGRASLYTAALHLTPRPDIHAIEALKPLFETSKTLSLAKLAAASMVHSYCKHNPYCREEAPVRQLAETLAAQVQQYCVASGDEESRQKALVCLKALGNMGVMSPENSMSVIKCIKTDAVQNDIRVAAAQSFRNSECHQQVTKELAAVATNQVTDTEVRIASYLAAVRCAEREDLDEMISKIVQEENTQVRSFILSHLLTLQESSDPYKERLRYLLSNFVLPVNFTSDFRKYSKNYHMSYFNQPLGLGAGYESNIIFSPGSYLPRSVDMNLTTVLGKIPINLGEFGVRFEGFEPIIKQLFGPKGYFWKTSFRKLLTNFINVLENKDAESFSEGVGHRREMRSIDISTVSDFLKKIYGKGKGKGQNAGAYVRYNGQEMVYGSWAGNLEDTDVKHLFDSFVNFFIESLGQLSKANVNTARTAQMKMDYSLASIQGIPLKLELEGTALLGFKLNNQQSSESEESAATLHLLPSLSLQIGGFVGFDSHLTRNGVKMENLVSSDSGLTIGINAKNRKELQLDINLPETMKILSLRSDIHLVRVIAGHEENKIVPDPVRDIRIKKSSCFSGMQSITGLHLCYDFDVPNIFRSTCLPLGRPLTFVLYAKKADVSMRGFSLKTSVHHGTGTKVLKVEVDTPGSSTPRKLAGTIMYERTPENLLVSASVESPNTSGNVKANLRHQDQYKAIEVVGNWNSNGMQSLAGLRIDMESRWDPSDKQIDLKIYAGSSHTFSPDLMIMEIIFKEESNGEQKSLDFTAKTMGSLRRFLTLSAEAGVDLKYNRELKFLIPQKLRKLAMEGKIGSITLLATIQEESDSKYASLLKISQMETELIGINARHDVIHSEGCELEIKTSAEGRIKDASYKGALILASGSLKKGFMLLIVRKTDNLNIVDIDIMHVNRPEISNTKFLVNIPEYMKMIKFESKLVKQEGDRYMLETAFIHGQETLLHIVGPVTMVFSVHSSSKLQADLKITTLASSQLTVSSALELSSKKTTFKVMTKHQEEILFSYNWVIQVDTSRQYNIKMDMIIPLVVNTEVEVMINAVSFHINMDTLVLPKQSPSRRIKALADLNLPNMEMRTNVAWDADRDPSKKLAADLKVTQSHVDSDRLALSGNLIYKSKNYRLFLEASGINMSPWKRDVRCQITTPTGETFKFDMNLAIRRGESFMEFQGQISCKDFGNRHHQFSEKLHLEGFHSQAGLKVLSQSRYKSPGHHVTMLDMETKYNNITSQRLFAFQAKISSPSLHLPLEIELKLDNTEGNYKTFLIAHSETPLRILDYEVAVRIHRGFEKIMVHLDMGSAVHLLEILHKLTSLKPGTRIDTSSPLPRPYGFLIEYSSRPSPQRHALILKSPSRTMEGELEYSPAGSSLRFYPNRERSESKYEIAAAISRAGEMPYGEITGVHGRISHPSLERDLAVSLGYTRVDRGMRGSIDIDVFQNQEYKISGAITSSAVTPDSFWMESSLKVPALRTEPHLYATAAYTKNIISFSFRGSESISKASSLIIAGRLDSNKDGRAAAGFSVVMDNQSMFEFSAALTPEEGPYCYGSKLHAIAHVMQPDYYEITSRVCNPAFIEISANKLKKLDVVRIRLGYRNPDTAEISLLVDDKDTLQSMPVVMGRINLASDSLIDINLAKDSDKLSWVKSLAHEEWRKISSAITSFTSKIAEKLKREARIPNFQFPPSEFSNLVEKFQNDLKEIDEDVRRDVRENPVMTYMKPYFERVWSLLLEMERRLCSVRDSMNMAFQKNFQGLFDSLIKVVVKILEMFEEGETPKIVQWIKDFLQDIPEIRKLQELIDGLIKDYPDDVEELKRIVAKIISKLEEDTDDVRDAISRNPALQKKINWFFRNYNRILGLQMNKFISSVLNDLLWVSVQYDENHLTVSIPSRRPITSLTQALYYTVPDPTTLLRDIAWYFYSVDPIPLRYILWSSPEFFPMKVSHLLPPYNRTAVIVEGKELLTFDGVVLRAPPSPCKVLLVAFKSNSLFMEHPHPSALQQLTLKTSEAMVVINPDYKVFINGQEIENPTVTQSGISVSKGTGRITVSTPFITLQIYTKRNVVSVVISGWAFGETAGLLGSYDGEVANDWLMRSGSRAPNLQELVKSWQEDQHCPTPSISPIIPSRVSEGKYILCQVSLNVRNTCRAIINPDPFLKICYAAMNHLDVAFAYRAMCDSKGISYVFPSL